MCLNADVSPLTLLFPAAFRFDPYGSASADQGERVVADDLAVFDRELDRRLRKRPRVAEFVSDAKNDARHVDAVGNEFLVVGRDNELLVDALGRTFCRSMTILPPI